MKLYHGTTEEVWTEIQKEGVLWGRKDQYWQGGKLDRITWLAYDIKHAGIYDEKGITDKPCVILEVEVPDLEHSKDTWQYVTYDPIPLSKIRRIK